MAHPYDFTIPPTPSSDFSVEPSVALLDQQIAAAGLASAVYQGSTLRPSGFAGCRVVFDQQLDAADEAVLGTPGNSPAGTIVGDHDGTPPTFYRMVAAAAIESHEQAIVEDQSWEIVGGVVTTLGFFSSDMAQIVGRCTFDANGDGGELRICAEPQGGSKVSLLTTPHAIADTLGAWIVGAISNDVLPPAGPARFTIEARLNGAASLSIRFSSLSLLLAV